MNEEKLRERIGIITILGRHIEKYINIFIFIMGLMALLQVGLIIYWYIDDSSFGKISDNMYIIFYYFLLLVSVTGLIVMCLSKKGKISTFKLAVWLHIFVLMMLIWATGISVLDLDSEISPLILITVAMVVGGILAVEPIYFTILLLGSIITIMTFDGLNNYVYFNGEGEIINFVIFMVFAVVLAFRHYNVTVREFKTKDRLEQLTYYDDLTGLLNERSYMLEIDKLNGMIALGKEVKFAMVVMDVNNLKATNDAYGHRYGCHLIVEAGHILPTVFKTSKCYHVGGDEFIAILYGDDYENIEERIKDFDKVFRYSEIEWEDRNLIFSVARGYAIYDGGPDHRATFQKADNGMYENKMEIKKTYKLIKTRD